MKILHIIDIAYEAGGAEKVIKTLRDSIQQRGHEVFVLATDQNAAGKEIFADALIPVVRGGPLTRLCKFLWNHDAYRTVRAIIRDFKPDIVQMNTIGAFSPAILWGIGSTPAIQMIHGPTEYTLELLPYTLPASDYHHGSYQWDDIRLIGRLRYAHLRYLQRPAYLLAMRRIKLVVAPSKFIARATAVDFPRTPIVHIYPGIVLPGKLPLPDSFRPTVLCAGRMEAVKGVDHLIKAFAHVHRGFPETVLRIVGDGSHRKELESLAVQLGLSDCVEFAGWVRQKQLYREYATATLLAIPSVWPEALGLVAVEAMATGRPIVGSNTGGIPELIDDHVTGIIVEPRDELGLASAIGGLLADRDRLVSAANASAVKALDFDRDAFADKILDLYQRVLDQHAPASVRVHP